MTEELTSQATSAETVSQRSILLRDYMQQFAPTDELPPDDLRTAFLCLFGAVGSVMATGPDLKMQTVTNSLPGFKGGQHAVSDRLLRVGRV